MTDRELQPGTEPGITRRIDMDEDVARVEARREHLGRARRGAGGVTMGQSLTIQVFYGARMPDPERGGPRPRLTQSAVEALPARPWPIDRDDLSELERIPSLSGRLDLPRSGVSDTWPHVAAKTSVTRSYDGIAALPVTLADDDDARATIVEALACLEWVETDYEGDDEIERIVPAPEIAIGWHVAGSYW